MAAASAFSRFDDPLLALGVFGPFEAVVGGRELDVHFDEVGRLLRDALEHGDGLVHLAGLQPQLGEQLSRGQVLRTDRRRALEIGGRLGEPLDALRMFPSWRLASKSLMLIQLLVELALRLRLLAERQQARP